MVKYRVVWFLGLLSFIFGISDRMYAAWLHPANAVTLSLPIVSLIYLVAWVSLYPRKFGD